MTKTAIGQAALFATHILLWFLPQQAASQTNEEPAPRNYIGIFYDRITLNILGSNGEENETLEEQSQFSYTTNADWILGLTAGYGRFSLSGSYTLNGVRNNDLSGGHTELVAIHSYFDLENLSWELFYHRYRGFHQKQGSSSSSSYITATNFIAAMKAETHGASVIWLHEPDRVILPGRNPFKPIPAKTGFSAILGARAILFHVESPEPLIPEDKRAFYPVNFQTVDTAYVTNFGMSGGVAGTFPIGNFIDLSAAIQLSLERSQRMYSSPKVERTETGASLPVRLGARFLKENYEVGIFGIFDLTSSSSDHPSIGWQRELIQTHFSLAL